jgi:bifunctional ADP-heptose synthase (sugar kinase/adenylyltransferase)
MGVDKKEIFGGADIIVKGADWSHPLIVARELCREEGMQLIQIDIQMLECNYFMN